MIIPRTLSALFILLIAVPFNALASDKTRITHLLLNHPYPCDQDRQKGTPTLTVYPVNPLDRADMIREVKLSVEIIRTLTTDLMLGHRTVTLLFDTYLNRLQDVLYHLNDSCQNINQDAPRQNNPASRKTDAEIQRKALTDLEAALRDPNLAYPANERSFLETFMGDISSAIGKFEDEQSKKFSYGKTNKFDLLAPEIQQAILADIHARTQKRRCQQLCSLLSAHPDFVLPSQEQIEAAFSKEKDYKDYQTIRSFIDQTGSNDHTLGILEQPVHKLVASQKSKKVDPTISRKILGLYLHLDEKHENSFKSYQIAL